MPCEAPVPLSPPPGLNTRERNTTPHVMASSALRESELREPGMIDSRRKSETNPLGCAEACGSEVQSTGGSRQALSQQTFAHHAGVASSSSINHAASAVNNDASSQSYLNNLNTSRPAGPGPSSQHPTSLGPSNALPNFGGYGSGLITHGPAPGGIASTATCQIR